MVEYIDLKIDTCQITLCLDNLDQMGAPQFRRMLRYARRVAPYTPETARALDTLTQWLPAAVKKADLAARLAKISYIKGYKPTKYLSNEARHRQADKNEKLKNDMRRAARRYKALLKLEEIIKGD